MYRPAKLYARVKSVDAPANRLTVVLKDGTERSYDPRRQQGVSVYREAERVFSVGDRVQLTAPSPDLKLANRELGTVTALSEGRMTLGMDGGRSVEIDSVRHPHLDHGYAVTSHSSQGQTADRVLIHVDTELGAKDLLNHRMAYVAVSRGAHDAQLFTDNRQRLEKALGRDVSHTSGLAPEKVYTTAEIDRHRAPLREALETEDAMQFQWIGETGTVQSYRHAETGKNIHIDSKTGQFYSQDGKPTTQEAALDRAMPQEWKQELIELGQGFGIGR